MNCEFLGGAFIILFAYALFVLLSSVPSKQFYAWADVIIGMPVLFLVRAHLAQRLRDAWYVLFGVCCGSILLGLFSSKQCGDLVLSAIFAHVVLMQRFRAPPQEEEEEGGEIIPSLMTM